MTGLPLVHTEEVSRHYFARWRGRTVWAESRPQLILVGSSRFLGLAVRFAVASSDMPPDNRYRVDDDDLPQSHVFQFRLTLETSWPQDHAAGRFVKRLALRVLASSPATAISGLVLGDGALMASALPARARTIRVTRSERSSSAMTQQAMASTKTAKSHSPANATSPSRPTTAVETVTAAVLPMNLAAVLVNEGTLAHPFGGQPWYPSPGGCGGVPPGPAPLRVVRIADDCGDLTHTFGSAGMLCSVLGSGYRRCARFFGCHAACPGWNTRLPQKGRRSSGSPATVFSSVVWKCTNRSARPNMS